VNLLDVTTGRDAGVGSNELVGTRGQGWAHDGALGGLDGELGQGRVPGRS
jgi:hypothetical protein